MREIRLSGSEGGEVSLPALFVNGSSSSLALTPHELRILRCEAEKLMLMSAGL